MNATAGRAAWAALLALALLPASLTAQQSSSSSDAPTIDAPSYTAIPAPYTSITVYGDPNDVPEAIIRAEAQREIKLQETQRIAVVVPNFSTVISGEGVRLAPSQKFDLAWHTAADPFNVVGAFVLGGLSELNGSHKGFGWGPAGYGKRVGANLADVVDGTMLSGYVYPVLLHQDPRYFRKGAGSFGSRVRHAMAAPFICRGDNGRSQPNLSNVLGNFSAGAISNLYYPDTGMRLTMLNSAIVMLEGSLGNIGLEFAPDVQARFQRHRRAGGVSASPAGSSTPQSTSGSSPRPDTTPPD